MAILELHWQRIYESLPMIEPCNRHLATMGYPDFLVSESLLRSQYGSIDHLPKDPRADAIRRQHKRNGDFAVYDMLEILHQQHGFEYTVFDLHRHRGIEHELDSNLPLPPEFHRRFGCVIDASVLEHCFNVAQAFRNLCDMVAVGGVVSTVNPVYMFNHGYYNINPIMLYDGFQHNGFEILSQEVMDMSGVRVPGFGLKSNAHRILNLVVARRIEDKPFEWPTQTHKGQHIQL